MCKSRNQKCYLCKISDFYVKKYSHQYPQILLYLFTHLCQLNYWLKVQSQFNFLILYAEIAINIIVLSKQILKNGWVLKFHQEFFYSIDYQHSLMAAGEEFDWNWAIHVMAHVWINQGSRLITPGARLVSCASQIRYFLLTLSSSIKIDPSLFACWTNTNLLWLVHLYQIVCYLLYSLFGTLSTT